MTSIVLAKAYLAMSALSSAAFLPKAALFSDASSTDATTAVGSADFSVISKPIINLISSMLWPLMGVVGAVGALYCIILGVKFSKAEEPQEHEKAKNHLKNAIIGFALIFILLFALWAGTSIMKNWYNNVTK